MIYPNLSFVESAWLERFYQTDVFGDICHFRSTRPLPGFPTAHFLQRRERHTTHLPAFEQQSCLWPQQNLHSRSKSVWEMSRNMCILWTLYIYMVNDTKKKLDLQVLINSNRFQLNRFLCHNHSLTGWNRWKICCRRGSLQILGTFSFHRCHLCCSELCSWLGRPSSRNLARPLLWVDRIAGISCCQIN